MTDLFGNSETQAKPARRAKASPSPAPADPMMTVHGGTAIGAGRAPAARDPAAAMQEPSIAPSPSPSPAGQPGVQSAEDLAKVILYFLAASGTAGMTERDLIIKVAGTRPWKERPDFPIAVPMEMYTEVRTVLEQLKHLGRIFSGMPERIIDGRRCDVTTWYLDHVKGTQ